MLLFAVNRIRPRGHSALLLLSLLACADASPVAPEPEPGPGATIDPVGGYTLALLDEKPLPADLAQPTVDRCPQAGTYCVMRGALTIERGGRYTLTYEWTRYHDGGVVGQTGRVSGAGAWTVRDSTVSFASDSCTPSSTPTNCVRQFAGTGRPTELVVVDGNRFVFRKAS